MSNPDLIRHATTAIADVLLDGDLGHAIADLAEEVTVDGYARMIAERILEALVDTNIHIAWDDGIIVEAPNNLDVHPNEHTLTRAKGAIARALGTTDYRLLGTIDGRLRMAQATLAELADDDLLVIDNPGTDPQRSLAAIIDGLPFGDRPAWALITLDNELGLHVTTAPDLHPSALAAIIAGADLILRQ